MDDQKLATNLLKIRKDGHPSLRRLLIGKGKVQLLRLLFLVFAITFAIQSWDKDESKIMMGLAGAILGAALKEVTIYSKIGRSWNFTEKVTNWDLVEELSKKQVGPGASHNGDKPPLRVLDVR